MRVVADTGPLNYLALIGRTDVLPPLFGGVSIPTIVRDELDDPMTPATVRAWIAAPPSWLSVVPAPASETTAALASLDDGERAAIALATGIKADLLLMDDRAGVAAARAQGLEVTGTLGVLDRAARRNLIDLPASVAALQATNFHARQELIDTLLAGWPSREPVMNDMHALVPASPPLPSFPAHVVPALVASLGDGATWRYVEFFTANIRNPNTRRAYARACSAFFSWCDQRGLTLAGIRPHDVGAYVEMLQRHAAAPSVKQQLAAIRMVFDWLVVGQVVAHNPAAAVRGPKHVVKTGKTPVLDGAEWRRLIDAIPTGTVRDLRDRALIATLTYSFARIGAALAMRVEDVRVQGAGWELRLHEKGGKQHAMPCHHALAEALHAYLEAAGIADDRKGVLFRTSRGRRGDTLSAQPMMQADAWRMTRRRAAAAGITAPIGCHTFRATGITAYLANGGTLEHAQAMAAHESPRTTKLYDRTSERLTREEVERITL